MLSGALKNPLIAQGPCAAEIKPDGSTRRSERRTRDGRGRGQAVEVAGTELVGLAQEVDHDIELLGCDLRVRRVSQSRFTGPQIASALE